MKIITEDTVAHSKAFLFMLDQYVKHLKAGHGDMEFAYGNRTTVTYATTDDGTVIGGITWYVDETKRAAWVSFSAVAEEHRQKGVYRMMFAEVEKRAKNKKAVVLYSGIHVRNDAMLAAAKARGSVAGWYRTKKDLR